MINVCYEVTMLGSERKNPTPDELKWWNRPSDTQSQLILTGAVFSLCGLFAMWSMDIFYPDESLDFRTPATLLIALFYMGVFGEHWFYKRRKMGKETNRD